MVSAIRGVSEPIGTAGGDALYPERAAASPGRDRIVADPGEIVARAPDIIIIIIIGSSCGKKFRPDQAAARPGWADVACGARRRTPRDQSPLILQPGLAALIDGLRAFHGIIGGWSTTTSARP